MESLSEVLEIAAGAVMFCMAVVLLLMLVSVLES